VAHYIEDLILRAVQPWWLVEMMWPDKVELIPHQRKGNWVIVEWHEVKPETELNREVVQL
jgi:hypothetical protein